MMNKLLSDSDWDSYSGSSESENQDDLESVYAGHLQSVFSSLEESIGRIDDLLAFERGFLPGDIVCYVEHPCGQIGRVVDVDMTVDLETLSGEIIQAVNSKNLSKFCFFSLGDHVVSGPWLGKVVQVVYLVTVLLDDGTKCEICTEDPELLIPVALNMIEDAQHPYYPGQRVRIRSPNVFKCVSWKAKQDEGTVCHVEVGLVHVNWITSGVIGQDFSEPTPPSLQDPKDLTSLSYFSHANWQVGDWCLIRYDDYDNHELGVKEQIPPNIFSHSPSRLVRKSDGGVQRRNPHCEQICLVVKTKSKVNVLWQDGNYSIGLDSQTLAPVDNVGDHEFLPEQFVIERGTYDNKSVSSGQRMGIVKRVDAKERTVLVKWASCDLNGANGSNTEFSEEIWSAYELIEHPEYSYCMGDIVIKVMDNFENLKRDIPFIQTNGLNHTSKVTTTMDGVKGTVGKKLTGECQDHISCIGIVTGMKDGAIVVKWATGLISKVGPYEIFGIDRHEDTASQGETMDAHGSQDRLEYAEQSPWLKKEKGVLEKAVNGFKEECKKDLWEATALSFPLAAIGFLTSVAKSLFCSHGTISTASTSFAKLNKSYPDFEDLLSTSDDSHILRQPNLRLQGKDIQEKEELPLASGIEIFGSFKQFDTVTDYADHHFVNGVSNRSMLSQVKREWLKKVNQEWNILEKNLPDSIFVRVYEGRMDLMRAAIVGSSGTPYHDGLFLFDIFIPSDYPNEPPMVHYNSGGLRLNPNLYESGKVCLSLLNTWTGVDTEMWNPDKSTVLQILLSLQALVLNEKPYFNEAGYHKQIGRAEGEKNSQTYNENAFLLSCKSMLYLLHKPPKNFEALVKEHFKQRSHSILSACKAYMDGVQVGCAFEAGQVSGKSQWSNSTGFKIMLAKLIPMLISVFNEIGVDCHRFLEENNGILEMDISNVH